MSGTLPSPDPDLAEGFRRFVRASALPLIADAFRDLAEAMAAAAPAVEAMGRSLVTLRDDLVEHGGDRVVDAGC